MDSLEILVLEDNVGHQGLIRTILSRYEFVRRVQIVSNMHEALHFLRHEFFNTIITDYFVDVRATGIDFLQAVRSEGFNIPSIILSGVEEKVDVIEAQKYGCFAVISKFGYYEEGALDWALEELRRRGMYVTFEHYGGVYAPANLDGTFQMVRIPEIILIESKPLAGVTIYTESQAIKTALAIKDYAKFLSPWNFCRTARNSLVNLAKVESFDGRFVGLSRNIHNINAVKVTDKDFAGCWMGYKQS